MLSVNTGILLIKFCQKKKMNSSSAQSIMGHTASACMLVCSDLWQLWKLKSRTFEWKRSLHSRVSFPLSFNVNWFGTYLARCNNVTSYCILWNTHTLNWGAWTSLFRSTKSSFLHQHLQAFAKCRLVCSSSALAPAASRKRPQPIRIPRRITCHVL